MPVFTYHAKNTRGQSLTGIVEAPVIAEAVSLLRKKELIIISVKETRVKEVKGKSVKAGDLVVFSRQLATMIESGITLVHALQILKDQTRNKTLALATVDIRDHILNGSALHEAMAHHPKIFSPLFLSLVKTGEVSGFLDETLDRVATYLEKTASLQRKIKTAMIYPALVASMAFIIVSLLLLKVVPTFEGIFKMLGGVLPLPTRILIQISTLTRQFFWALLLAGGLATFVFKKYYETPEGRRKIDDLKLRIPVFGELIQKVIIAKFARTLSTLVKSAIPIIQAIDIVAKTCGNVLFEEALNEAGRAIKHGEPIADPLAKGGIFPPMVVGMISVGEQTGQLEKMLTKVADLYDDEVDTMVNGLTAMIEPFVIAFLGVVIGGIVIALFMPIFTITQLIH